MNTHTFRYDLIIKENYLDMSGHVNNARYLTLFEEARWEMIVNRGYGVEKIKETGLGHVVLEIKIKFMKELKARDKITITTQVIGLRKKLAIIHQQIWRDNILCCDAEFTGGLFDLKARKLVTPTPEWLYALGIDAA